MLRTKFRQNHSTRFGEEDFKGFSSIYMIGHGGHLGQMTSIMLMIFYFHVPKSLHIKFG